MKARRVTVGQAGFTLLEVAVTLVIVTLLLGGIMIPLQTQIETRKIDETQRILENAREALLGYAASHGYFPCPADATTGGMEPPSPPVDHATGACPSYFGFLPAALLGFTPVDGEGFGLDAWGGSAVNRIRYAVSSQTVAGVAVPFTTAGGMSSIGIPAISANSDLLYVCGSGSGVDPGVNCGTAQRLASNVVAVIWSLGPNAASGGTSAHEAENPNPNSPLGPDRIFVSRVRSTAGAAEFDDQITWISGFMAVSRLIASGQLP